MKYFVSPTRPFGSVTFNLQMEKHGVYQVHPDLAHDLYVEAEATPINRMEHEHIERKYKNGDNVYVGNYVRLWGEEWDDKDLFRLRLTGDLKKEIVDTYNPPYDEE